VVLGVLVDLPDVVNALVREDVLTVSIAVIIAWS